MARFSVEGCQWAAEEVCPGSLDEIKEERKAEEGKEIKGKGFSSTKEQIL